MSKTREEIEVEHVVQCEQLLADWEASRRMRWNAYVTSRKRHWALCAEDIRLHWDSCNAALMRQQDAYYAAISALERQQQKESEK